MQPDGSVLVVVMDDRLFILTVANCPPGLQKAGRWVSSTKQGMRMVKTIGLFMCQFNPKIQFFLTFNPLLC